MPQEAINRVNKLISKPNETTTKVLNTKPRLHIPNVIGSSRRSTHIKRQIFPLVNKGSSPISSDSNIDRGSNHNKGQGSIRLS